MRKPKQTPEEKQFVKDLRAVLKRMPDHLCLVTPHYGEQINVMRKNEFSTFDDNNEPMRDASDSFALVAEIEVDAREDSDYI